MSDELTIVGFTSYDEANKNYKESPLVPMGGFFSNGMRWKDYIETQPSDAIPYLEVIKDKILSDKLKICGFKYQNEMVPLFSDGTAAMMTLRSWGDLMAAIWSEEENKDYNYCDFAWSSFDE